MDDHDLRWAGQAGHHVRGEDDLHVLAMPVRRGALQPFLEVRWIRQKLARCAGPGADARSASTFGKVNTAKTMRELQFGLKYVF